MIDKKDCTIIIPHLGSDDQQEFSLNHCLDSLMGSVGEMNSVLAKNGSENCLHAGDVDVASQGQCKAVNAAVATVNTEWVFITNDDMIYAPGWWDNLTQDIPKDAGSICPNLVEPRDGAPPFLKYFCGGAGGDFKMDKWLKYAKKHMDNGKTELENGFNFPLLIKKSLWDTIGGYDVNYDPWGSNSDSDLQAKIHLAGYKTYRQRSSVVYHFSQTSGTFHPEKQPYWSKNWEYFKNKWGFERQGESEKVWYSKDLIDYKSLKYHPKWEEEVIEDALKREKI